MPIGQAARVAVMHIRATSEMGWIDSASFQGGWTGAIQ